MHITTYNYVFWKWLELHRGLSIPFAGPEKGVSICKTEISTNSSRKWKFS